MTVSGEYVSANSVPAAAVIQRMQALSGMIGRKASVGGFLSPPSNPMAQLSTGGGNYQDGVLVSDVRTIEILGFFGLMSLSFKGS
ncbi:hypothetical protein Tco_0409695 [Tanacetum coccineum]